MKKIINIILVILMFCSCIPCVKANTDISQGASKGDLRLGTYTSANKNKVSVSKTDANGVTVKKEVTKTSAGNYDVEFFVSGPTTTATTQIKIPVYVVFVIDRSYSMRLKSEDGDTRWKNAEDAAIDISEKFHSLGVNMAAVSFSGGRNRSEDDGGDNIAYNDTVDIRAQFSTAAITEFGDYDINHNTGGGTNMYAGLKRAQELLAGKNGLKHIILLTDGVPTFYYNESGYTKGAGNSNSDDRIEQVPAVVAKTKEIATTIKNAGTTIHAIGYHFDKLTYVHSSNSALNERALAVETLTNVASPGNYHLVNSYQETNLSIEFDNIKTDISTVSMANNPVIIDGIGNNFKLSGSSTYGGSKTLSKTNFGVTTTPTSIGKFSIQINPNSPTEWYETNNDFTFSYTHATKGTQTITVTENPEVFWSQPAPYTIYHVERGNESNVLGTDTGTAEYNAIVPVNQKTFTGYTYNSKSANNIKIDTANNIAYVYYDRNLYGYTISHVEIDSQGNQKQVLLTESASAKYDTEVSVNKKNFTGFTYVRQDKQKIKIDINPTNNTATVYYTRNSYDYDILHLEYNNIENVLGSNNGSAPYQSIISVPNRENEFEGFTYHSQDKNEIVINTTGNNAKVYYTRNYYDYTINHIEVDNPQECLKDFKDCNKAKVLETKTFIVPYETNIEVKKKDFTGFTYLTQDKDKIVVGTGSNTATVYYTRNSYDYTINHVELGNEENVLDVETDSALYGTNISVTEKEFEGFSYDSKDKENIVINTEDNIATVYYKRNNYSYTVEHYKETLDGEFKLVKEDVKVYKDVPFASKTIYEVNEYAGYTYLPDKTENAEELVPANNDLVIRLYYDLNESKAIIYHVVKQGDYYYSFKEFGSLEDNLLSFENVNLEDDIIVGKIGTKFEANKRIVPEYYLAGVYAGNILENANLIKLEQSTITDTLDIQTKEYTFVYEIILGEGDGTEDIILPPQTGFESNLNSMNYLLFICAVYILTRKKVKLN